MGTNFQFDKMLPTILDGGASVTPAGAKRQVQLFKLGEKAVLRMGPLNEEDAGLNRYAVELSADTLEQLADAIEVLLGR